MQAAAPTALDLDHLPEIDLRQLLRLTDDTGMLQHATYLVPDHHHGYCVDDNCRALLAAIMHAHLRGYDESYVPLQRYLAFLAYGFNEEKGRFRNFMSYDRKWLEEVGSEESHARTLWALGATVRLAPNDSIRDWAEGLLRKAMPAMDQMHYIRPWSYCLFGLRDYLDHRPDDEEARGYVRRLGEKLLDGWKAHATDEWPWWEDELTWGNAVPPRGLLDAGAVLDNQEMIDAGLKALEWLTEIQTATEGHFRPIGNRGWYQRGGTIPQFDQQPIEAQTLLQAYVQAARLTEDHQWADRAIWTLNWFLGHNDLSLPLYNTDTGGGHDGLQETGVNSNQGAESTLAYLLSVLELHVFADERRRRVVVAEPQTLGLGVVGASAFAAFCLESYAGMPGVKPVSIWNRTHSKAERLAGRFGMQAHDTIEDLANDPDVDMVLVATTPALHGEHSLAMLRGGKHVLSEKPIATTLNDFYRMQQAALERDLRLSVDFMMRYGPLWEPVKNLLHEQLLGLPLRGFVVNCAGDEGLPVDHWFWDTSRSGGIFIEHGVHFFDLIRSWLGEGNVRCAHQEKRRAEPAIDQVYCDICYGSQTSVSFYHGFHQTPPMDRQTIRLICEHGELNLVGWINDEVDIRAVLPQSSIDRLRQLFPDAELTTERLPEKQAHSSRRTGQAPVDALVHLRLTPQQDKQVTYANALRELMSDFAAWVRDARHVPRITGADGRTALEQALSADHLARAGLK